MKRLFLLAAAAVSLSACSTLGGDSRVAEKALENLEHCERTYQAAIGALGTPGGSLFIRCPPKPYEAAPAAAPEPAT